MTKPHCAGGAATVIGTVADRPSPPHRKRNAEVRAREYLTDPEVGRLVAAAGGNRHGHATPPWCWSRIGTACGRPSW